MAKTITQKDLFSKVYFFRNLSRLLMILTLISTPIATAQSNKSSGKSIFAANRSASNAFRAIRPSTPAPNIIGKAAIVIDARTGRSLYVKRADEKRPVASTQKLLTALLSLEKGHMNPSKPMTDDNIIPQCKDCNKVAKNDLVFDQYGRVRKLTLEGIMKRQSLSDLRKLKKMLLIREDL